MESLLPVAAIVGYTNAGKSTLLNTLTGADAYAAEPNLEVLLTAPYFVDALGRAQDAWRHIVGTAATAGIPSITRPAQCR